MNRTAMVWGGIVLAVIAVGAVLYFWSISQPVPPVMDGTATTTPVINTPTNGGTVTYPGGPYKDIVLGLDAAATFYGDLTILPTEVVEDSRCPIDVTCIQKGRVRISLDITSNGKKSTSVLEEGKSITVNGETITFTSVAPAKRSTVTINPGDYRFTFSVDRIASVAGKCYVGGCSSEVCSDQPGAVSTCIFRPEFGCYKTATCTRQSNGQCGWTQTAALTACLANPPA